jgi:hypothetical protein
MRAESCRRMESSTQLWLIGVLLRHYAAGLQLIFLWPVSAHDLADLFNVIDVVSRHMRGQFPDRDPPTLGMNTKALPLLGRELLQELQVHGPN